MSSAYPRVLLINHGPINRRYATGITMGNLLRGWPLDRIAQIYCGASEPDKTVCLRSRVRRQLGLDGPFVFYPAMLWEHKNHLRLLQALAQLRDERDMTVRLICSGAKHEPQWSRTAQAIDELHLSEQVRFVGLVDPLDLRALYRLTSGVVVPTLFEAASAPMYEAWHDGAPVAASTVTSFPEQAGDAPSSSTPCLPPRSRMRWPGSSAMQTCAATSSKRGQGDCRHSTWIEPRGPIGRSIGA